MIGFMCMLHFWDYKLSLNYCPNLIKRAIFVSVASILIIIMNSTKSDKASTSEIRNGNLPNSDSKPGLIVFDLGESQTFVRTLNFYYDRRY